MANQNGQNHPIRVALLGAGYISDYHYKALRALPQVDVRAVCDLNQRLVERFASANGIPAAYSNLGEMLAKEKLDVVHVLTPPHVHFPTASQILEAGVDTFIEKPLCHTVAACQDLRQRAEAAGPQGRAGRTSGRRPPSPPRWRFPFPLAGNRCG